MATNPTTELVHVTNAESLDDGTPAEPEQQTVSHVIPMEADVAGHLTRDVKEGSIPAAVVIQNPVASLLGPLRYQCSRCRYFDNTAWVTFFRKADHPDAPIQMRTDMNKIRAGLLTTQNARVADMSRGMDGDVDAEHAIRSLGFCRALEELLGDYTVVHPSGSCPAGTITPTQPQGLFKSKDLTSERAGNAAYDALLLSAQGKIP